ncbi:FAD/NAD(P)-binding domain-containing protein [Acaromyces ingoldii]|uniref:FAD/NAD(P)-binding domain-containing protein n=1 Tax=Acaromyces ingoldii TaxID=215250 RepID=A0A316YM78_9BASI|nr:FAD/NAD(P)-binding domain-containing protein [Acaromyces ingoldii]PWN90262.1 FAD/NAD(P)-binding domain-containing protein [Acaromyces ingoldii]
MSGALDAHYDVVLIGTSLPNAILSAALSRSGYKVLHIDEADHYGGPWASLTLQELLDWSRSSSSSSSTSALDSGTIRDVDLSFPAYPSVDAGSLPAELQRLNRHFSLSLAPALLPCKGPTIDVLVRSKVASYCTFRLLERTSVYHATPSSSSLPSAEVEGWPLRKVPSSKEDIFKDKTMKLADKRRLMKLLQAAASSTSTVAEQQEDGDGTRDESFLHYLTDEAKLSMDLARDVAYGVALCSSSKDSKAASMERIKTHIDSVGRYGNSAYLVGQYGGAGEMAQCFCRAAAVQGATFVLSHRIERLEKDEGPRSWKLKLEGVDGETSSDFVVGDADCLRQRLPRKGAAARRGKKGRTIMKGVLVLDRSIPFDDPSSSSASFTAAGEEQVQEGGEGEEGGVSPSEGAPEKQKLTPPETALIVFPPSEESGPNSSAVTALQMGEGTFSCPKGTYVVYLSSPLSHDTDGETGATDPKTFFQPYRNILLRLAGRNSQEFESKERQQDEGLKPLMELYYSQVEEEGEDSDAGEMGEEKKEEESIIRVPFPPQLSESTLASGISSSSSSSSNNNLVGSLDLASRQAEEIFWDMMVSLSRESPSSGGKQTREQRHAAAQDLRQRTAEANRRQRKMTYAVGQGLGGVVEATEAEGKQDDPVVVDFFPIEEDGDEETDE